MVMIIGYTAIAMVLIVVGVDVSKVFLAQRALAGAADSAALAAAEGVDVPAIDRGPGPQCGAALPLDAGRAQQLAADSLARDAPDLHHTFDTIGPAQTDVAGGTVTVEVTGRVAVPFGDVLAWLAPSRADGEVRVSESSSARSPVTSC